MDINGRESNGTWESKSLSEGYSSDESFEIIEFEPDRDENISKDDCLQSNHIDMNSFEKWRLLGCRINQMDEVAVRLDQLLREDKISKDQIFYKYLSDTVAKFYNKQHTNDADVTEFYSTIMYLGGMRTFNFLLGPMFYGQRRMNDGNRDFTKININLAGPSESLCLRQNTAFTCKSGIFKSLGLLQLMVSSHDPDEGPKPLISNSKLIVFACCYSNDETALKESVEFDPVTKRNIGLTVPVDLNFVKEHDPPDPKILKELIVTEAVVGSVTMLHNKVFLPVSVDYTTKAEKAGQNMKEACENLTNVQILH